jgi:hypothetical protein
LDREDRDSLLPQQHLDVVGMHHARSPLLLRLSLLSKAWPIYSHLLPIFGRDRTNLLVAVLNYMLTNRIGFLNLKPHPFR